MNHYEGKVFTISDRLRKKNAPTELEKINEITKVRAKDKSIVVWKHIRKVIGM